MKFQFRHNSARRMEGFRQVLESIPYKKSKSYFIEPTFDGQICTAILMCTAMLMPSLYLEFLIDFREEGPTLTGCLD